MTVSNAHLAPQATLLWGLMTDYLSLQWLCLTLTLTPVPQASGSSRPSTLGSYDRLSAILMTVSNAHLVPQATGGGSLLLGHMTDYLSF